MISSTCDRNSNGIVLLQLTEANLTSCSFQNNALAGLWCIGDSCTLCGCSFEGNCCCACTVSRDTAFSDEQCCYHKSNVTKTFLIWKIGRRAAPVKVGLFLLSSEAGF
jgi:hypothetical protein